MDKAHAEHWSTSTQRSKRSSTTKNTVPIPTTISSPPQKENLRIKDDLLAIKTSQAPAPTHHARHQASVSRRVKPFVPLVALLRFEGHRGDRPGIEPAVEIGSPVTSQ